MKDQYVGDVNDFFKYALLRALAVGERLGVVWMLTAGDGGSDGARTSYLRQGSRYRRLDPPLFDRLSELVHEGRRTVLGVEEAGLLGEAEFVSDIVRDDLVSRDSYFDAARDVLAPCSLVFFDPDNGLPVQSVTKGRARSSKYVYWDELAASYADGKSLVVYQHFPRVPRATFLEHLASRARDALGSQNFAAISTAHVAFLLIAQPDRAVSLESALIEFAVHASPFVTAVTVPAVT